MFHTRTVSSQHQHGSTILNSFLLVAYLTAWSLIRLRGIASATFKRDMCRTPPGKDVACGTTIKMAIDYGITNGFGFKIQVIVFSHVSTNYCLAI